MAAGRGLRSPSSAGGQVPLARAEPSAASAARLSGAPQDPLTWRQRASYLGYRAAATVASALPDAATGPVSDVLGRAAAPLLGRRADMVARHAGRVRGRPIDSSERRRAVQAAIGSYVRYWIESLRLPTMDPRVVDARFSIEGLEHIERARADGTGPILAIPHLGGWDVGGSWLVRQGIPLTVVVEPLEPPELFEWFADLRRSFGLTVVPLGKGTAGAVLRALRANQPVALLSDRDIGGGGVEVEFFGERTTLPAGPATLALRSNAPILPTAIYFSGRGHHAVVRPPLPIERTGRLRDDVARVTQALAHELEHLIRAAPEQWHLFQPNWPSDRT